ncbi:MAG TPA: LysM peptidoglycan-binding domain-containing protein [Lactobacillaceae bacterium]|jgi:LysM repeat protein
MSKKIKHTLLAAAGAAAAFVGTQAASADSITVKSGDTVNALAASYGVSADEIVKANGLSNRNLIIVGQKLEISAAEETTTAATSLSADGQSYTVQAGDSLSKIAQTTGVSVAQLETINGLASDVIVVGTQLSLTAPAATTSTQTQTATPAKTQTAAAPATTTTKVATATSTTQAASTQTQAAATPAQTQTTSVAASSEVQTLLNSLNAKRAALGLAPVTLDASLTAQAQSRAENAAANGGIPTNHFSTNGEVVANGFSAGSVIDAWYNETNMITNGTPGHRMWVANARATSVGFGIVGGIIVGESNVGQY